MVVYCAIKFVAFSLLFLTHSLHINVQQNENFLKVITWLQFKVFLRITVPFGKRVRWGGEAPSHGSTSEIQTSPRADAVAGLCHCPRSHLDSPLGSYQCLCV